MKPLSPEFQAHLDGGATTLAWAWRLTRADGTRLGFTDHDRDLSFDGTSFEAATGFTATEIKDSIGLGTDNLDVDGALRSDALNEDDLAAGLFDNAIVEIWRVNWADVSQRVLMRKGTLGEVSRTGAAFTAEVRGLAQQLQQPKGRLYQYACDADLGDTRCKVDLNAPSMRGLGTVAAVSGTRQIAATGLGTFAGGWFTRGRLEFASGANVGRAQDVRTHAISGGLATFELWQPFAHAIAPGDTFRVTAGCDKHFATCQARFGNGSNFRGFPHIPGSDVLTAIARPGQSS